MESVVFPSHIDELRPYVPGLPIEQVAAQIGLVPGQVVKLASNENPLGASPRAIQALAAHPVDISRYPDADVAELTSALALHHGVPRDWVVAAAGSEAVLGIVASMVLCPGRSAVFAQFSFQAMVNAVQRTGATSLVVASPDHYVDLEGLLNAIRDDTALVYVANPGNPTGTLLDAKAVAAFVARVPAHVAIVLDEAYFEYVDPALRGDAVALLRRHPNLIVARTFSKAYGLAGLRVGYGLAQPRLAGVMRSLRAPFSVTQAAQVAAIAALDDEEFLALTLASNSANRQRMERCLNDLGLAYRPSSTNFLLVRVGDGMAVAEQLKRAGLIVRPVSNYGLPEWIRISVGTETEVDKLASVLQGLINPAG